MLGWRIITLASATLKASVRFPPLRGMYQRGTCEGCDTSVSRIHLRELPSMDLSVDVEDAIDIGEEELLRMFSTRR